MPEPDYDSREAARDAVAFIVGALLIGVTGALLLYVWFLPTP